MNAEEIRFLITDLDGVLRFFPEERDREIERSLGFADAVLARTAFESSLLQSVITGRIGDSDWRLEIVKRLKAAHPHLDGEEAVRRWSDFPGRVDPDVLKLLRSFGKPLALLTNATSRLKNDLAETGLIPHFARIFNSSEIGWAKPSAEIFHFACRELGIEPRNAVFIDDSPGNVQAAADLGFRAVHFTDATSLRRDLEGIARPPGGRS